MMLSSKYCCKTNKKRKGLFAYHPQNIVSYPSRFVKRHLLFSHEIVAFWVPKTLLFANRSVKFEKPLDFSRRLCYDSKAERLPIADVRI
jgi:hypothetical protein